MPCGPKIHSAPALPVVAILAGLSALLAACGGGASPASVAHIGSTTTSAPAASASASPGSQLQKFVSCMRHHGVPNFPELVMTPNGGAVPVGTVDIDKNSPAVQGARRACGYLAPPGSSSAPTAQAITSTDQVAYIKAAGVP